MRNILQETLEKALEFVAIKGLPELVVGEYDTRAIVKVKKQNGVDCYCIGRFNFTERKTVIQKDFYSQGGNITEVLATYPLNEKSSVPKEELAPIDYSLEQIWELFDKHNLTYPKNKKNDKKWLEVKLKTVLADRESNGL